MKKNFLSAACIALSLMMFSGCGKTADDNASQQDMTEAADSTQSSAAEAAQELGGIFPQIAGENGTIYRNLFEVILDDKYDDYWNEKSASIVGEEAAEESAESLKSYISCDIYGQEAVDTYAESDGMSFDCWYINDAMTFEFKGDQITSVLTDGTSSTHTYEYLGVYKIGEGETMEYGGQTIDPSFECDVYKSTDDAGEFTYFFLRDDTMEETYHIEFRYGSGLEELQGYFVGKYAYWLSAGIDADADEETIHNVIDLFITENLSGTADTAAETVFDGGSGTKESPYEIAGVETFKAFADSVNDGSQGGYAGKFIRLTADIDLDGTEFQPIGNMNDMETMSTMFLGSFDGGNHTISNFSYETDKQSVGIGIFGMNCGEIRNLNAENSVVTVTDLTSQAIGGVVGYNMGGTVENVSLSSNSKITGNCCVGGIIGGNSGTVKDCIADGIEVIVIGDNEFGDRIVQCDIAECGGLIIGGGFGGTIDGCKASGKITSKGNEPVGIGGIGGCLEMMDSITNCEADVIIELPGGGHAIGGLCGYAGTHSDPDIVLETEGISTKNYPCIIDNCNIKIDINANGATHVGGIVGTGLYYYGEETRFKITNCAVTGSINGAVTPGTIAGRAKGCEFENNAADVEIDGNKSESDIGSTDKMYESADQ